MNAQLAAIVETAFDQQKDNLCGPFWAARILNESGFKKWDGEPITEDLVALRAGTLLPEAHEGSDVPPGATPHVSYRYQLPIAPVDRSGTSADALARSIEAASGGGLCCVPLSGEWNAHRVGHGVYRAVRCAGCSMYPVTSRSKPVMLGIFRGFAISRIFPTLRSRRICAPMP